MSYTTQQIADIVGISIYTLRYYEDIGLLDPVQRAANGHRRYGDNDVKRLDFLKRLKATGMKLADMVHYVELFRAGDSTITERRLILEEQRRRIDDQIAMLQETCDLLDTKITNYQQQEQTHKQEQTS